MKKNILFIQGGGEGGYEADKHLVASLQQALGKDYAIQYPELSSDETAPDFGWPQQIGTLLSKTDDEIILAAHSLGASMLLKYLSEYVVKNKKIAGVFLLAAPFWEGKEEWKTGLKLKEHFSDTLPKDVPFFFYQCRDDEEVPFSHLEQYRKKLSRAAFREISSGGHTFHTDLSVLATDISAL
ncbi:alpha/beta hydrolase [Cytophaga hutchinsonii]|uniref:Alpha/beta hydrolase n=1 Tax=Cytophaga hutchinsonii (strain ATCC 33406 / DSM 1761 / CIP 103989 / NBRC 15051 / NCIMB 9469 / D465) TaxID=269798 RepID=A0A6N4ST65_CYTH3|nr:alpha/beta hydrolase [Cytophaga hutchinsonii]ABG59577.1 conserved hypothetical protein [Cytophaga hutchinsonii ATCC 33406]SFY03249.1 hypothetical protein SAMN04487930_1235 [Cytophaga hutchinsonii ATCC 33406]